MTSEKFLQHFMCALAAVSACNLWLWWQKGNEDGLQVGLVGLAMFGTYVYAWHLHKEPGHEPKKPKQP